MWGAGAPVGAGNPAVRAPAGPGFLLTYTEGFAVPIREDQATCHHPPTTVVVYHASTPPILLMCFLAYTRGVVAQNNIIKRRKNEAA
jgi:hypothetical protein